jgi:hypothetical protein
MQKSNYRTLRGASFTPDMLPSPLPLYKLPVEAKIAKTGCAQRLAQLPAIRHIFSSPSVPEPILIEHTQAFHDKEPTISQTVSEEIDEATDRTTVYMYYEPTLRHSDSPTSLQFNSVFESGNLLQADRVWRRNFSTQSDKCTYEDNDIDDNSQRAAEKNTPADEKYCHE